MRKSLEGLTPYPISIREGFTRLDNNESYMNLIGQVNLTEILSHAEINRYPTSSMEMIKRAYAEYVGLPSDCIVVGNGSDECISLIGQFCLDPDNVMVIVHPDFSMYEKSAKIMGATTIQVDLHSDFSLPVEQMVHTIQNHKAKLCILSNPCNPTGRFYPFEELKELILAVQSVNGIIVIDEAYIEFASNPYSDQLLEFENVILLRTASKALGMAALRLGFMISNQDLIHKIEAIKQPYNVNTLSALVGAHLLSQKELQAQSLATQKEQIEELRAILTRFVHTVTSCHIYPSETNFILMEYLKAKELVQFLLERKIAVRFFGKGRLMNALRISAGSKAEHEILQKALQEWSDSRA